MFRTKKSRTLAIVLAATLAVSALAVGLGNTFAAKPDVTVNFTQQNSYPTLEKGTPFDRPVTGGRDVSSSNTAIATATLSTATGNVTITGVKAGVVDITNGSSAGWLAVWKYQIIDSGNLTGYTIKRGAEVYINGPSNPGKTFSLTSNNFVTTTPAAALSTIKWRSLQPGIAEVNVNTGLITAKPNVTGVAIIVGEFTDKWGVDHDLHILVGVGVDLGGGNPSNPNLSDLMEWIKKGEAILGLDPNPYTTDSLDDLAQAVDGGKDVIDNPNPTDQQIKDAIDDIKQAIEDLELKGGGGIIGPDPDGNYYKPVGDPPNVYEIVNQDGSSKYQPPRYVWNPRNPKDYPGDNRPAEKDGYKYYVEDPDGSNIWKPVKSNDGTLDDDNAIWGGSDGKPGGGDDKPVKKFGSDWWVSMGQNVWRKVNGPQNLGPLTGGGTDRNPTTDPVTQIFDNTAKDGRYYVGPLGPDETGYEYYYGDPKVGGDGFLDSTASSRNGDDVKYYRDDNGNMVTEPPIPPIDPNDPTVTNPGRVLTPDQTGDSVDWIEIAKSGGYSLIVRKSYINIYTGSGHYGDPAWQYTSFGTTNAYGSSNVRTAINNWFKTSATVNNGDNLPAGARLRDYTMQNNAIDKLGMGSIAAGMANAFSKPNTYQVGDGNDVAFALSYTEVANFCSKTHDLRGFNPEIQPSSAAAIANFNKLSIPAGYLYGMWLRTPGDITGTAGAMSNDGRAFQYHLSSTGNSECGLVHPALWVRSTIFTDPVVPSIPGLDDSQPSLNGTVSIDGRDWVLVRRKTVGDGKYAMLVSKTSFNYGQNFHGSSSLYEGSNLQTRMTGYYNGMNNMKKYAVVPSLGDSTSQTATSEPTSTLAGSQTKNIFFAISYQDWKNWGSGAHTSLSIGSNAIWWSRTQVNSSEVWDFHTAPASREAAAHILGNNVYDVVGVWVRYA